MDLISEPCLRGRASVQHWLHSFCIMLHAWHRWLCVFVQLSLPRSVPWRAGMLDDVVNSARRHPVGSAGINPIICTQHVSNRPTDSGRCSAFSAGYVTP